MSTIDEQISEISSRMEIIESEIKNSSDKNNLIQEYDRLQKQLSRLKVERFLNDIDTIR